MKILKKKKKKKKRLHIHELKCFQKFLGKVARFGGHSSNGFEVIQIFRKEGGGSPSAPRVWTGSINQINHYKLMLSFNCEV